MQHCVSLCFILLMSTARNDQFDQLIRRFATSWAEKTTLLSCFMHHDWAQKRAHRFMKEPMSDCERMFIRHAIFYEQQSHVLSLVVVFRVENTQLSQNAVISFNFLGKGGTYGQCRVANLQAKIFDCTFALGWSHFCFYR